MAPAFEANALLPCDRDSCKSVNASLELLLGMCLQRFTHGSNSKSQTSKNGRRIHAITRTGRIISSRSCFTKQQWPAISRASAYVLALPVLPAIVLAGAAEGAGSNSAIEKGSLQLQGTSRKLISGRIVY